MIATLTSRSDTTPARRCGYREAAILLRAIGEDQAASAASRLWPRDVQRLGKALASLEEVSVGQIDAVLDAFLDAVARAPGHGTGAGEYLQHVIDGAPTRGAVPRPLTATTAKQRQFGLRGLQWLSAPAIARFLRRRSPGLQAMTLACFAPARAADVVGAMGHVERCQVLQQLAAMPDAVAAAGVDADEDRQSVGRAGAAALFRRLDAAVQAQVVSRLRETDAGLAEYLTR
jgi:flagellar motor switch protein FliG